MRLYYFIFTLLFIATGCSNIGAGRTDSSNGQPLSQLQAKSGINFDDVKFTSVIKSESTLITEELFEGTFFNLPLEETISTLKLSMEVQTSEPFQVRNVDLLLVLTFNNSPNRVLIYLQSEDLLFDGMTNHYYSVPSSLKTLINKELNSSTQEMSKYPVFKGVPYGAVHSSESLKEDWVVEIGQLKDNRFFVKKGEDDPIERIYSYPTLKGVAGNFNTYGIFERGLR